MAQVRWNHEALDSLVRHDAWRLANGWEAIASELIEGVEAYFMDKAPEQPPRFMPGRPATLKGQPKGLRMVTIAVRSKRFRAYFRYRPEFAAFEIVQVLHPHAQ